MEKEIGIMATKGEDPRETLQDIRKKVEKGKGRKNLVFRIPGLEKTTRYKWYLTRAREKNGGGDEKEFIVALQEREAVIELGDHTRIQVYEKDKLLETLYSYRGIYQLPPVPTQNWFFRKIK